MKTPRGPKKSTDNDKKRSCKNQSPEQTQLGKKKQAIDEEQLNVDTETNLSQEEIEITKDDVEVFCDEIIQKYLSNVLKKLPNDTTNFLKFGQVLREEWEEMTEKDEKCLEEILSGDKELLKIFSTKMGDNLMVVIKGGKRIFKKKSDEQQEENNEENEQNEGKTEFPVNIQQEIDEKRNDRDSFFSQLINIAKGSETSENSEKSESETTVSDFYPSSEDEEPKKLERRYEKCGKCRLAIEELMESKKIIEKLTDKVEYLNFEKRNNERKIEELKVENREKEAKIIEYRKLKAEVEKKKDIKKDYEKQKKELKKVKEALLAFEIEKAAKESKKSENLKKLGEFEEYLKGLERNELKDEAKKYLEIVTEKCQNEKMVQTAKKQFVQFEKEISKISVLLKNNINIIKINPYIEMIQLHKIPPIPQTFSSDIGKFIEKELKKEMMEQKELEDKTCLICTDEYEDVDDTLKCDECLKRYHKKCIQEWMKRKSVCPMCRAILVDPSEYPALS